MLGYVMAPGRGRLDQIMADLAQDLHARGVDLAGVVQINGAGPMCDMDLRLLSGGQMLRISQDLGAGAQGCRLDGAAMGQAVGLVEAQLRAARAPGLVLINKFGKEETAGRGFRPAIAQAMERDIPVLIGLPQGQRDGFDQFAEALATPVAPEAALAWCLGHLA